MAKAADVKASVCLDATREVKGPAVSGGQENVEDGWGGGILAIIDGDLTVPG